MRSEDPEKWRYQIAVVALLALLVVVLAVWGMSGRQRYVVTYIGGQNAIKTDAVTGETWLLTEDDSGRISWRSLPAT